MYKGSCLCGAVKYEINGDLGRAFYCHCNRCRKASGSAFAANAMIDTDGFRLISGTAQLKCYHNDETGLDRMFCSDCGSPILSKRSALNRVAVRLGTLDTDCDARLEAHIFVASKANWHSIADDLPCFSGLPDL